MFVRALARVRGMDACMLHMDLHACMQICAQQIQEIEAIIEVKKQEDPHFFEGDVR